MDVNMPEALEEINRRGEDRRQLSDILVIGANLLTICTGPGVFNDILASFECLI